MYGKFQNWYAQKSLLMEKNIKVLILNILHGKSLKVSIKEKMLAIDIHYLEDQTFFKEEEDLLEEILQQLKAIFDLKLTWIK